MHNNSLLTTFKKHLTGLTLAPIGAVGGTLYAASVAGPLHVGLRGNLSSYSVSARKVALARREQNGTSPIAPKASLLGSIVKQFAAPVTWTVKAYKAGYQLVK